MSKSNYLNNIEFEEGYYKEVFETTLEAYREDYASGKNCPEGGIYVEMPKVSHNYFEEAETIDGTLKENWIKTMNAFKQNSPMKKMQASIIEKRPDEVVLGSCGVAPYLSQWSPYHGALYTVVLAIAKSVACGGDYRDVRVGFEEYYDKTEKDPKINGKALAAQLGAYEAMKGFDLEGIKEEEFQQLNEAFPIECYANLEVCPEFRTVGMNVTKEEYLVTSSFKKEDNKIVRFCIPYDKYDRPVYKDAMKTYKKFYKMVKNGYIQSAYAVGIGGTMEALAKMCYEKNYGVRIDEDIRLEQLSQKAYGAIVAEVKPRDIRHIEIPCMFLGEVIEDPVMEYKEEVIDLDELFEE